MVCMCTRVWVGELVVYDAYISAGHSDKQVQSMLSIFFVYIIYGMSFCRSLDLLCSVKYKNTLPDIPFDAKFLSYPFDSQR